MFGRITNAKIFIMACILTGIFIVCCYGLGTLIHN